ncbi:ion transporter [Geitlerinema sp. PCC 9228]|jgi:voltage-gated potassium channel|uniref:ion transporter n=1 Tax=Geitlerinema sp. PCC 9228 TaxID=111611 RepID=UPI0008F9C1AA|nr:ion transporter [Geitlerinema sp. PCC 9228]
MYFRRKRQIFQLLETNQSNHPASRWFDIFLMGLIGFNIFFVIVGTVDSIAQRYDGFLKGFEVFSVAVFTIEYILRVWTCTLYHQFAHPIWGRIHYIFTPLALIDLLAIAPFYLPLLFPDLRFLRALRLFRLFRLLKMGRYSQTLKGLARVLKAKREDLVISFFTISILLVFSSSLIYFVEHEAQPEAFPNIPASMWWGVVTLTTVGYGDVYPITPIGKVLGAALAVLGIGIFALPAGILASGFAEELEKRRERRSRTQQIAAEKFCPHCGKRLDVPPTNPRNHE